MALKPYIAHRQGFGVVTEHTSDLIEGEPLEDRLDRQRRGVITTADLGAQRRAKANAPTAPAKPNAAIVSRTGGPREVVYGTPEALDRSGECPVPD